MTTIDLSVVKDRRKRAVQRARERNIIILSIAVENVRRIAK